MISKVLVTGSSGILGRVLYNKLLDEQNFVTHGLVFSRTTNVNKIKCDLTSETEVNLKLSFLKVVDIQKIFQNNSFIPCSLIW